MIFNWMDDCRNNVIILWQGSAPLFIIKKDLLTTPAKSLNSIFYQGF
jgi:hypothetical protein